MSDCNIDFSSYINIDYYSLKGKPGKVKRQRNELKRGERNELPDPCLQTAMENRQSTKNR
jgi:hypothetical protein